MRHPGGIAARTEERQRAAGGAAAAAVAVLISYIFWLEKYTYFVILVYYLFVPHSSTGEGWGEGFSRGQPAAKAADAEPRRKRAILFVYWRKEQANQ